ncbi:uncharacterized protein LOC142774331 [Rhipicephalus microplus]|uniref:uncharacterized protein LOC142774331 n=1 Tax=Rhipicephalus microplus TaxID=6941 RepID=UPI003F6C043B
MLLTPAAASSPPAVGARAGHITRVARPAARAVADSSAHGEAGDHRQRLSSVPREKPPQITSSITRPDSYAMLQDPMAVHQPHPGRRSRSVSFDDGKPRVIPTELDPDVDPVNLKTVVGRPPTPRPSRGDLTVTPPEEHGENSRPPSASSKTSLPAHKDGSALNPETLMVRLTLECAGEAAMQRASDESAVGREGGEGVNEDARAAAKLLAADEPSSEGAFTSEGSGSRPIESQAERGHATEAQLLRQDPRE